MKQSVNGSQFGQLFKKYRLRSEIETLEEFGDLLAEEGLIYDTSLFTRWQKGERVPKERRILLAIIKIFTKLHGITKIEEANELLYTIGLRGLVSEETLEINNNLPEAKLRTLPEKNDIFIGRESIIKDVVWNLLNSKKVLIHGMPGVGKTKIALHISYNLINSYRDGIYWFRLDLTNPITILNELLLTFGVNPTPHAFEVKIETLIKLIHKRKLLLILDNADSEKIQNPLIQRFLNSEIPILITSIEDLDIKNSIKYKIQPFTREEYKQLSIEILGRPFVITHESQLELLGTKIGFLPILSNLLLKQINTDPLAINDLVKADLDSEIQYQKVNYDSKNLFSAFTVTINKLDPQLQNILVCSSYFYGVDFSVEPLSFLNNCSLDKTKKQIFQLISMSFIEKSAKGRFRLHPAIQLFLQIKQDKKLYIKLAEFYIKRLRSYYRGSFRYLNYLQYEYINIKQVFDYCFISGHYDLVIQLWECISTYIFYSGEWDEIYSLDSQIRTAYKKTGNQIGLALYYSEDLGRIFFFQNKELNAMILLEESNKVAIEKNNKVLEGLVIQKYGIIKSYMGNYDSAKDMLENSLILIQKSEYKDQIAKNYAYLGLVYVNLNRYKDAILSLKRALILCKTFQDKSIEGFIYVYLGLSYLNMKDYNDAEKYYMKGLEIQKRENVLIGQAMAFKGLGEIYLKRDKKAGLKALSNAKKIYTILNMNVEISRISEQITQINQKSCI